MRISDRNLECVNDARCLEFASVDELEDSVPLVASAWYFLGIPSVTLKKRDVLRGKGFVERRGRRREWNYNSLVSIWTYCYRLVIELTWFWVPYVRCLCISHFDRECKGVVRGIQFVGRLDQL